MLHLDYLSCFLTILATVLVSRKSWTGLLISIVNSMIVCLIGFRTAQFGFIPANLLCICVYAFSIRSWVKKIRTCRTAGTTKTTMVNAPYIRSSMTPKLRGSRVEGMLRPRRIIGNPTLPFPIIRRSLLLETRHRSIRTGGRFPESRKLRCSKASMQPSPSPAR
jgi:hypothetical protein